MNIMPIEKITTTEHEMMSDYIRENAADGGMIQKPQILNNEIIFREWNNSKAHLFNGVFGQELILHKTYNVEYSISEIWDILWEKIEATLDARNYYSSELTYWRSYEKICVDENGDFDCKIRNNWYEFTDYKALIKNVYEGETFFVYAGGKKIKVQNGCKVFRTLRKITELTGWNLDGFEALRCIMSEAGNYKTRTVDLNLSIHPLDYMTMSDNNESWHSCMSWTDWDGGEYRVGTVEMMNSPYVVVGYISEGNTFAVPFHSENCWNSKSYRNLFILHEDFARSVCSYPYGSKELDTAFLNWIRELYQAIDNHNLDDMDVFEVHHNQSICNFETYQMYNDTYYHTGYGLGIMPSYFNYSGVATCMWCGEVRDPADCSDTHALCCEHCLEVRRCVECGCRLYDDNEYGDLCEDCYNNLYSYCNECDDSYSNDLMICVRIDNAPHRNYMTNNIWYGTKYKNLCEYCAKEWVKMGILEPFDITKCNINMCDYIEIYYNDLTEEQKEFLGFPN